MSGARSFTATINIDRTRPESIPISLGGFININPPTVNTKSIPLLLPTVETIDGFLDDLTLTLNHAQTHLVDLKNTIMQNSLVGLADAIASICNANQGVSNPRTRILLTNFWHRFPPIVSSLPCPLPQIGYNPLLAPALLLNCSMLAVLAQDDESLPIASLLSQHNVMLICLENWVLHHAVHDPPGDFAANVRFSHPILTFTSIANLLVFKYGRSLMSSIVSKVGAVNVASLVTALFNRPSFPGCGFVQVSNLASCMDEAPGFVEELLRRRVVFSVLEKVWRQVKLVNSCEMGGGTSQGIMAAVTFVTETILQKFTPQQDEAISLVVELITTRDLVSLYATALYRIVTFRKTPDKSEHFIDPDGAIIMNKLRLWIAIACSTSPTIITSHVQPLLLPVLNRFLEIGSPKKDFAINSWTKLVECCKEIEDRPESSKSELIRGNKMGGCCWYQCIFNGGNLDNLRGTVLYDENCGSVQYCNVECQKRDWYDGGHRLVCCPTH